MFSVALNRGNFTQESNSTLDPNLGVLAFGGVAPVPVTNTTLTVPIQGFVSSSGTAGYFFYALDVDSYNFPGSERLLSAGYAILDTGTTLTYIPSNIARAFNERFQPPARFVQAEDTYYVDCDAIAPNFNVTIAGVQFAVDQIGRAHV